MTTVILGPVGVQREQRSSSHHSRRALVFLLMLCHICLPGADVSDSHGHHHMWVTESLPKQPGRAFPHHQMHFQQIETNFMHCLNSGQSRMRQTFSKHCSSWWASEGSCLEQRAPSFPQAQLHSLRFLSAQLPACVCSPRSSEVEARFIRWCGCPTARLNDLAASSLPCPGS